MKPKQEARAATKHAPQTEKAKASKAVALSSSVKASTPPATAKSDFDDVAELFGAIKQTKANRKSSGGSSLGAREGNKKAHTSATTAGKGSAVASASPSVANVAGKPVRDGLYHAPQKSVQMSDNVFFSGTWLKADQEAAAAAASGGITVASSSGVGSEASQEVLRQEGVNRIVSMDELSKMLSRSSRAGTTPNCPFDCDCCF